MLSRDVETVSDLLTVLEGLRVTGVFRGTRYSLTQATAAGHSRASPVRDNRRNSVHAVKAKFHWDQFLVTSS